MHNDKSISTGCHSQYDIRFNDTQQSAVQHYKGAMLVFAGPGSGKTAVITGRILHLIHTHHISPEQILTITFTKKAAIEMKQRCLAMDERANDAVFGTFHAVFYQILLQSPRYHGMKPCTVSVRKNILKEILYAHHIDSANNNQFIEKLLQEISFCKNNGMSTQMLQSGLLEREEFCVVYQAYNRRLHENANVDFEDMLLLCYEHLKKDVNARKIWQNRFKFIQIDEYQDINKIQYEIIKLLVSEENNIFVVGDDDQAIYGFRGSNPQFMNSFLEDFAPVKTVLLDQNYRCNKEILDYADKSIIHNKNRFAKKVSASHCNGDGVKIQTFEDERLETDAIIKEIRRLKEKNHKAEIAILYRTNKLSAFMEERLYQEGFVIQKEEKTENIYDHQIAKDVIAYFQFIQSKKRFHFLQIMNKPVRYISRDALKGEIVTKEALLEFYNENEFMKEFIRSLFTDLKFMEQCDAYSAYIYLLKKMGYEKYAKSEYAKTKEQAEEIEKTITALGMRLKSVRTQIEFIESVKEWEQYYEERSKTKKQSDKALEHEENAIQIMTYHASKGLEFDHVFLPGIDKYVVPHKKAVSEEELEEERRMFYVAMTRARYSLWVSNRMEKSGSQVSLFWEELKCRT